MNVPFGGSIYLCRHDFFLGIDVELKLSVELVDVGIFQVFDTSEQILYMSFIVHATFEKHI